MKTRQILAIALGVGICIVLMLTTLKTAFTALETQECQTWMKYDAEIAGFYWTDWQLDQCRAYGYPVDKK